MQEIAVVPPVHRPQPGDELALRLLRGRRGHGGLVLTVRVLPTALLLTAVHLLLTGSRLSRSWWWQDDLNILAEAAGRPLDLDLLLSDYNGHLVPGSWLVAWVLDRVAPLQWWPAALLTLIVVAATDLMLLALLRRLFGTRPAILLPFAMFCSTSLALTSTLWWAAALQWLPVSLSLVTALWFHVGYLRTRRPADAAGALLAVVGGLVFFEKALTTTVVLAFFTIAYGVPGPLWRRPWRAIRRYWVYWLGQGALAGGFLALYLSRVTIDTGATSKTSDVIEVTRLMILETLLPSLIGGPLSWYSTPASTIAAWPHPSTLLLVAAVTLTVAAVIGSLVLVRGSWRAWVLLAIYLGISVTLVARIRLGFIGPFIGRDHRYLTDLAVMAPLCLALAWLPLRGGSDAVLASRPSRLVPERAVPDEAVPDGAVPDGAVPERAVPDGAVPEGPVAGDRRPGSRRARLRNLAARRRAGVASVGALAVVLMTAGGAVSGETFMNSWSTNPTQAYFDNLSADLAAHAGPVYLFGDEVVPNLVMTPTFMERRRIAWVTRPMDVRPVVRAAVPSFSVVDKDGHLHNGVVRGIDAGLKTEVCASTEKPAVIQLPTAVSDGLWKLRMAYYANRQSTARVAVGSNPPVTMRLERGLHQVYVSLQAGGSTTVRLDGLDPDTTICIGSVTLGLPGIAP